MKQKKISKPSKAILYFVLFTVLLFCADNLLSQVCSFDSVKQRLVDDWQRLKKYTIEYIDAMPEHAISFKPVTTARSFAETMLHGAQATFIYASLISGTVNPYPYTNKGLEQNDSFKVKTPLLRVMNESFDFMISNLKKMKAEKLGEIFTWAKRSLTIETYIRKIFEHQVHMTGQCVLYLKLKNIKVPEETLF